MQLNNLFSAKERNSLNKTTWQHSTIARIPGILYVFCSATGIFLFYQIAYTTSNSYHDYRPIPWTIENVSLMVLTLFLTGLIFPTSVKRPSDFFIFFYGLIVLVPYSIFYQFSQHIPPLAFLLYFGVLALPILVFGLIRILGTRISLPNKFLPNIFKNATVVYFLAFLSFLAIILAMTNAPPSAGFGFSTNDVYARRLEGRLTYPAGTLSAYLNMMVVNGIGPFLAFYAGWRLKIFPLLASLFCVFSFYYLIGLKAPIFYVVLTFIIGFAVRRNKIRNTFFWFGIMLLGIFLIFLVEHLFAQHSYAADYVIRRAFLLPADVLSMYFDFLFKTNSTLWSPFTGSTGDIPTSFLIGKLYFGNPQTNANTNTFIYNLADQGLLKYIFTITLVAFVFTSLDIVYRRKRNAMLLCISFLFALLILEQAATTALVSSGIGLLIVLTTFAHD